MDVTHQVSSCDVYVLADGSTVPVDAAFVARSFDGPICAPSELVDLALGLLFDGAKSVDFVWIGDLGAGYRKVRLERVNLGRRVAVRLRATHIGKLMYELTKRELDIVTCVIAGLSNAAIAEALTVSPRTVTTHVDHIMRKMGASSRSAAATGALDAGIIAVPFPIEASEFQTLRIGRVVRAAGSRGRLLSATNSVAKSPVGPIMIGSLVPLEGRAREDGIEMIRGASLAIDEINARSGVHGHNLQLVIQNVDIDRTGLSSVTEATRSLLGSGVHAITSGYLCHQGRAVELAAAEGVPLLHASAASFIDDIVASDPVRYRGIFHVCPNDRNYAPNFVDFLTRLRDSGQWTPTSRELVVASQSLWEIVDFGLDRASKMAEANGWHLIPVAVSDLEVEGAAWAELPARIGRPAAVMLGSFFADDHLSFMGSFLARPSPTLIYSIYAPSIPTFRSSVGRKADGLLWATTAGTYSDEIAREFALKYEAKFASSPGRSMAGIAYDRIKILAQAWREVDDVRDFDNVSSTMLRMRFRGVNGSYQFSSEGQGTLPLGTASNDPSIAQAHTIFQIQNGRNVLLDPNVYAAGRFTSPAWSPAPLHAFGGA